MIEQDLSVYLYISGLVFEPTPNSLRMPLGSHVAIQPNLNQEQLIHLFDTDPRERTGTMDPKSPIGTYG